MPIKYQDIKSRWDEKMERPLDAEELGILNQVCRYIDGIIEEKFDETEKIKIFLYYFNFTTDIGTNERIVLHPKRKVLLVKTLKKLYNDAGWDITYDIDERGGMNTVDYAILTPLNKKND